jgi:hypothetical protein
MDDEDMCFDCLWLFAAQPHYSSLWGKYRRSFPAVCGDDFVCDIHRRPLFPHPVLSDFSFNAFCDTRMIRRPISQESTDMPLICYLSRTPIDGAAV